MVRTPTLVAALASVAALALVAGCDAVPSPDPTAVGPATADARPPAPGTVVPVADFDPAAGELSEGVAVDRRGRVYVSVSPLGEVRRVFPDGSTAVVAAFPVGPDDNGVLGLEFDRRGRLHAAVAVADDAVRGVWRVPLDGPLSGGPVRVPGTGAVAFPNDVAFDARGALYVSDSPAGAVWRVPPGGTAEVWATGPELEGTGAFGLPFPIGANGLAYVPGGGAGALLVANTERGLLARVPVLPDGTAGPVAVVADDPAALFGLDGIAVDARGRAYGAVNALDKVVRIDPDGAVSTVAEGDAFDFPASLAFGAGTERHALYVANYAVLSVLTGAPDPDPGVVRVAVGPPGGP